jgi:hypothetical protein
MGVNPPKKSLPLHLKKELVSPFQRKKVSQKLNQGWGKP